MKKSNQEVNRERFAEEKQAPIRKKSDERSKMNQRVRRLDPTDYEGDEFETFEKFHRSR